MKKNTVIIIAGPTGVGKTNFVNTHFDASRIEIINGDMGQMYVPLTIGTAKPAWQTASAKHHLFDILSEPILFSAMKYRAAVTKCIKQIWKKKKTPVIVGGSSFYLLSLFFPPTERDAAKEGRVEGTKNWDDLYRIDPQRAKRIHPHDTYRIQRALHIWHATGIKPSEYVPAFNPIASCVLIWLDRDTSDLYARIDNRVDTMLEEGWLKEVKNLENTEWHAFLKKKKIIGYDLILDYFAGAYSYAELCERIKRKTRQYAKRQRTFWRSFKRKLQEVENVTNMPSDKRLIIHELNLTRDNIEGYIKQLKIR